MHHIYHIVGSAVVEVAVVHGAYILRPDNPLCLYKILVVAEHAHIADIGQVVVGNLGVADILVVVETAAVGVVERLRVNE